MYSLNHREETELERLQLPETARRKSLSSRTTMAASVDDEV